MKSFAPGSHIHLVGIAGSGMSGIAQILLARGFSVSGSDAKDSETLRSLRDRGAATFIGHAADQVGDARYLVISSAINERNPEVIEAKRLGIEVLRRSSALALLLPGRYSIAVAGTHGKTTTSAMLAQTLREIGRDPSFVIGSQILSLGESAHEGVGDEFIVEADESDGSFLDYQTEGAIITNVELDHVDNFTTIEELVNLFSEFISTVKEFVVICGDDPIAASLPVPTSISRITYGLTRGCDLQLDEVIDGIDGVEAALCWRGQSIGTLKLAVHGRHNALNAAAVIATAISMGLEKKGLDKEEILQGIARFTGTSRRFEVKGVAQGVTVIDDYGHHPTEIAATILAARTFIATRAKNGRLAVVFQPHRFSRTAAFLADFAQTLGQADRSLILDIYSAGEKPIAGISSEIIATQAQNCSYVSSFSEAIKELLSWSKPGDLIVTMGAGDITLLGPEILIALSRGSENL